MSRMRAGKAVLYGAVALSFVGCSTVRSAMGGAMGGLNTGVSNAAGAAVAGHFRGPSVPGAPAGAAGGGGGGMGGGAVSPQMMTYYANWMFTLAFNSGGYALPNTDLKAGQSVTFQFQANDSKQDMERAFLKTMPDGKQWWRVQWYNVDNPQDSVVFEAEFSADRTQVLRMRGKTSGQQAGEIPVEQGTGFSWSQPTYLTQESLDAATVGTESVTTSAGTFTAKHIKYTMMGGGNYEWWASDQVPGGVVKYVVSYGGDSYTQTLVAMSNSDTTSVLGSF
jgi:hypothetical protein